MAAQTQSGILFFLVGRLKRSLSPELKHRLSGLWRRLMFRTTVIAITGSMGKTTTKEILSLALATQGKTLKTRYNQNGIEGVSRTLRSMRPWHKFAVIEVGTDSPGSLRPRANLVRPDIAIMLCVAETHQNNFHNLENTAKEKSELLRALAPRGIAILNRDDPNVLAMAKLCPGKIHYFGTTDDSDFKATNAYSHWPEGLSFDFHNKTEQTHIKTQLLGNHWLTSTNAALAAASICGVPLSVAAESTAQVTAFSARLQPIRLPNGATFIRDEIHASITAYEAMMNVLINADAKRKGVIIGGQTDSKKTPKQRFRALGKEAAQHCDFVIFVGDHSHHGHRAAVSAGMDPAMCPYMFGIEQAADWLKKELRDGDVVFMKGRVTEHLTRIMFAQFGDIGCWKSTCMIRHTCDSCPKLEPKFDLNACLPDENSHPNLIAGK